MIWLTTTHFYFITAACILLLCIMYHYRPFFKMHYWRDAVLLHCTRLHCLDLNLTAWFSCTVHPIALLCNEFCVQDCTDLACIELHVSVKHCTLLHWSELYFDTLPYPALSCPTLPQTGKKTIFCWTLNFLECTFDGKRVNYNKFEIATNGENQIFNLNAFLFFLLTGTTWYYHTIFIYFASFTT